MKIYKTTVQKLRFAAKKPLVLAIGIFDGVHCGHQRIIKQTVRAARAIGGESAVMTFAPHPLKILSPRNYPLLLISLEHRIRLISNLGVDYCFVLKSDKRLLNYTASVFAKNILSEKLNIRRLIIGSDFAFGRNRQGGINNTIKLGKIYGFGVSVIKKVRLKNKAISSTKIRGLVELGNLARASRLLGRRVSILGTVVHGKKRGKTLGFPTANINPHHEAIPPQGVYAVEVKLDNKQYFGMLNIGFRPTFANKIKDAVIEVNIFNFHKNIYGRDAEIFFLKRMRDEKKFDDAYALAAQIKKDRIKIKQYLRKIKPGRKSLLFD